MRNEGETAFRAAGGIGNRAGRVRVDSPDRWYTQAQMPSQKMAQPSLTSEGTVGVSGAFAAAAALADFSCSSTRAYPADRDQVSHPSGAGGQKSGTAKYDHAQAPPARVRVMPSRLVGFSRKLKMTTASTIVKTCFTLAVEDGNRYQCL